MSNFLSKKGFFTTGGGGLSPDGTVPLTAPWTTKYRLLFPDGTAAAPSMAFESHPTWGFFWDSSWGRIVFQAGDYAGFTVAGGVIQSSYMECSYLMAGLEVNIAAKSITAGAGTGLTVNHTGTVNRQVYKVTVDYTGFSAAALTADHTIATLPAKTKIVGFYADTTVPFTGGGVSAASLIVGKTAGGVEYIATHDVLSGAIMRGLVDADMGTELVANALIQGGAVMNWTGTTTVIARLTTVTDTTDHLAAGSVTFFIVTERY